ncbi:ABC transporter ATP-binding protein [Piscinibacter gummiphilus]|uniref:Sulfonate ABC transporter ATP-binding protein n=1 Tax=Piscinibacter gummiphilus TaxID=946333 RepID=A0A1W6LAP9_9BURK|nr:ABC transporter ATP-binding protein [Piscinibacter gummiphilus]ARN21304.1 sulfonate ABC transporter ATP-binding protein [Piscinibacter gummiphilus]GLS96362.1 ABC transporter ATP-binding protein [Piscinibacter gummiphilus]
MEQIGIRFGAGAKAVDAVRGVDLSLAAGEFVSIVGPSGCGKSTLLNVVAGFTRPTEGRALLDGEAITGPGPDRGVVFQQYSLFPWLTVRGNVEYGLRVRGLPRAERAAMAYDLLARCGLSAFASHHPEQLSGGMRQRVGIVRALANEPRVLLLDEPFGALDAQTREVMQALLLDIWQRFRTTVLFITHDIEEAVFLSDRVCAMSARPGRILADLPVPLPRPRDHGMTRTSDGARLVGELRSLIRAQSLAAFDSTLA